jgi:proteic killer suppression protein
LPAVDTLVMLQIKVLPMTVVPKIRRILARLQAATSLRDLDAPGLRLHSLKGGRNGEWAVDVDRNWRITFSFDGRDCSDVNYEDYH